MEDEKCVFLFFGLLCSVYFFYFCICYGYYLIVIWLFFYFQIERGFDGGVIGLVLVLVVVVGVLGVLFFSYLLDKFCNSKVKVIFGLEIVVVVMLVFMVLFLNIMMLMVSLMLYGLLGKMVVDLILIFFVFEQVLVKSLGRVFSFFNFFGMSLVVVVLMLIGFILDVMGLKEISFVILVCLVVIGMLIFVVVILYKKKVI